MKIRRARPDWHTSRRRLRGRGPEGQQAEYRRQQGDSPQHHEDYPAMPNGLAGTAGILRRQFLLEFPALLARHSIFALLVADFSRHVLLSFCSEYTIIVRASGCKLYFLVITRQNGRDSSRRSE